MNDRAESRSTHLVRLQSTTFNLDNVSLLGSLGRRVLAKKLDLHEAKGLIKRISQRSPRYGLVFAYLSYILSCLGIAYMFRAGWHEMLVGTMVATIAFGMSLIPQLGQAFPAASTVVGTMLVYMVHQLVWRLQIFTTIISGVIIFVPGLNLAMGMVEVAKGHVVSGTARFVYATTSTLLSLLSLLLVRFAIAATDWEHEMAS